ncbi:unnamed protein product [Pleuronectes platessa]|uniref:Uncharacterized protein n=1 Tax=Pleuronectes platessa TaxID=8262 RepID=A0A9N7U5M5_PLEPL|nr:unnamed protein product [Pleuronectes platessa]
MSCTSGAHFPSDATFSDLLKPTALPEKSKHLIYLVADAKSRCHRRPAEPLILINDEQRNQGSMIVDLAQTCERSNVTSMSCIQRRMEGGDRRREGDVCSTTTPHKCILVHTQFAVNLWTVLGLRILGCHSQDKHKIHTDQHKHTENNEGHTEMRPN